VCTTHRRETNEAGAQAAPIAVHFAGLRQGLLRQQVALHDESHPAAASSVASPGPPAHVFIMTNHHEIKPVFWIEGPLTGGELRTSRSPDGLVASLIPDYGQLRDLRHGLETAAVAAARAESMLQSRFAFACTVAAARETEILAAATLAGTWSIAGENSENLDRLHAPRQLIPSHAPWPASNVKLVIVHPLAIGWERPQLSRSLVVIDPRTPARLLGTLAACGALTTAGRLV
jgi:hypothetical protein